jgi:hypothetical protein
MATFTWEAYHTTPSWVDVGSDTFVFCGSKTDISVPITVGTWNSGTHIGSGDPGSDQCTGTHVPNVEYVSDNEFKLDGGSTQNLNDTNLDTTECTLRIRFNDASSVTTSSVRFYCFDSTTTTTEATGVEAYAFERGVSASTWEEVNDDSTNLGGDNTDERLDLIGQGPATDHTWYIAVSARPESVGSKPDFDFGIALTYS